MGIIEKKGNRNQKNLERPPRGKQTTWSENQQPTLTEPNNYIKPSLELIHYAIIHKLWLFT
jgi:hypothetical protein